MKLQVIQTTGKSAELEVLKSVFGETPNKDLLAQAVRVYLFNQRQGTAKVQTRSDVSRTKKKWYRQKGTGGARHGARTPSLFVGGGVAHGPNGTTDWTLKLTASQRRKAMVYALSAQAPSIAISGDVEKLSGKTKLAAKLFDSIAQENSKVLVVLHEPMTDVIRACANLERVLVTQANRLNVYEILLADKIIMTEAAVHALEAKYGSDSSAQETKTEKAETVAASAEAPAKAAKPARAAKTEKALAAKSTKAAKTNAVKAAPKKAKGK